MGLLGRLRRLVIIRRVYLFEYPLQGELSASPIDIDDDYRLEFPANLDSLPPDALRGGAQEHQALTKRVRSGDVLGLIWHGKSVVHRSLVQVTGPVAVEGRRAAFDLQAGDHYVMYCETVPEHTGRGLYPAMLYAIARTFKAQGKSRRLLISCRTNNGASIRGILKAGFRYHGTGLSVAVLSERFAITRWRREGNPDMTRVRSWTT